MTILRRLTIVTTCFTFLLVVAGGLVRATSSGLGCPDWPKCHGSYIPPLNYHSIIEWTHRFSASVVITLTLVLAATALIQRRRLSRLAFRLAVVTVPIVFSQALLGALVVALDLHAEAVVGHLLVAMSLLAVLVALLVETSTEAAPGADREFARRVTGVAFAVLALLLLGSWVSGRGAGLVYDDWPLFGGHLVPDTAGASAATAERMWMHFAHRALAAMVVVAVMMLVRLAKRVRPQAPAVTRLVRLAAMLVGIEVLLGAGNVWTDLSPVTRALHLALGGLVWATLFGAARLAWRLPAPAAGAPGPQRSGPAEPVPATAAG